MAQLWGLVAMRLADSRIVPFNYTSYADAMDGYLAVNEALALQYNMSSGGWHELRQAIAAFGTAAAYVQNEIAAAHQNNQTSVTDLNNRLRNTERHFLSRTGIPKRPFYKHSMSRLSTRCHMHG
jgi:N-acetylated-alpha-linked acidic dipeptidase